MATSNVIRLSDYIKDPIVRRAYRRAERDYGQSFALPDDPKPTLAGGAVEQAGADRVLETGEA